MQYITLFNIYKSVVSPLLHQAGWCGCRYLPTCSEYAEEAFRIHGIAKGSFLATKRILSCNPFGGSGFDPVPGSENVPREQQ